MFNEAYFRKGGKQMKYFIVADVHGFYDEMLEALDRAGFDPDNPNHTFVSLGDALDRGKQANEVLGFFVMLPKERRIFILGNHEILMEEALHKNGFDYTNNNSDFYNFMIQSSK